MENEADMIKQSKNTFLENYTSRFRKSSNKSTLKTTNNRNPQSSLYESVLSDITSNTRTTSAKKTIVSNSSSEPELKFVELNFNGQIYQMPETSFRALPIYEKLKNAATATIFDEETNTIEYFIEHNAAAVIAIIEYFQKGELHIPKTICFNVFKRELSLFEVDWEHLSPCCFMEYATFNKNLDATKAFRMKLQGADIRTVTEKMSPFKRKMYKFLEVPETRMANAYHILMIIVCILLVADVALVTDDSLREPLSEDQWLEYYHNKMDDLKAKCKKPRQTEDLMKVCKRNADESKRRKRHVYGKTMLNDSLDVSKNEYSDEPKQLIDTAIQQRIESNKTFQEVDRTTFDGFRDGNKKGPLFMWFKRAIKINDTIQNTNMHNTQSVTDERTLSEERKKEIMAISFSSSSEYIPKDIHDFKKTLAISTTPVTSFSKTNSKQSTQIDMLPNRSREHFLERFPRQVVSCECKKKESGDENEDFCEDNADATKNCERLPPEVTAGAGWLEYMEIACIMFVAINNGLMYFVAPNKMAYLTSFHGVTQTITIVSFVIHITWVHLDPSKQYEHGLQDIINSTRVILIFEIIKNSKCFKVLRYSMMHSIDDIIVIMLISLMFCGMLSVVMFNFDKESMNDIPNAYWFVINALTSVTYGDTVPASALAKFGAGICAFLGVFFLSIMVPLMSYDFNLFYEMFKDEEYMRLTRKQSIARKILMISAKNKYKSKTKLANEGTSELA